MSVETFLAEAQEPKEITLRGHQEEALEAIVRGLSQRPGVEVPDGLRVNVKMATGTGKSYVGAVAGQRIAPRGSVLVVVPTLDLLLQMIGSWRRAGRSGRMYAVCSLEAGELPFGVERSTNPVQIAYWLAAAARERRPVTLFATYASTGAVQDAYQVDPALLGGPVPPLDLLVCDEAHRSSGSVEKTWTVVHDQGAIPAGRRLYMTATPRVWAPPRSVRRREGAYQPLEEGLLCSMDDTAVYGECVFDLGLQAAVDRGLLAPFEIVVLELRDPVRNREAARRQPLPYGPGVGEDEEDDQVHPERVAAMQAALVKTMAERKLRRVITFHTRTIEARYFSETLNQTVERLHTENPGKYPEEFWSQWISGEHSTDFRQEVINGFGSAESEGVRHAVMSNCLVLGEGVDIPSADGVLLQGYGSMVQNIQRIGRAVRLDPDNPNKVASLLVVVFLKDDEEPDDFLESDSYAPLVKILTSLRAHDAKVVENLAVPQRSGHRTSGRSAEAVQPPGLAGPDGAPSFRLPVRFLTPRDPDSLALFVRTRVLTGEGQYWREGIAHARAWHQEFEDLDVPYSAMTGKEGKFPLGKWLSGRRVEYAAGDLAPHRVDMLDRLGMVWSVPDARFEAGLDWARVWAREHGGSLAAPARASIGGYPIGTWLAGLRAAAQVPGGQAGALSAHRRRQLEEIDPWWCPAWPITWQRSYATARRWWLEADGRVDWAQLSDEVVFEGEQLGQWVRAQRAVFAALDQEQQDLLAAIGIEEDQELAAARAAAAARPKVSRADRFQQGLAALASFVEREGHARVPRTHKEDGTALGTWLNNQKARRNKLSPEQLGQLAGHGVEWA
ncbi:Helicase associated domain protein [Kitasatospora sp. NPDC096077]|uniref:DEAD/DEAH box helicase n=1 Tax=Kitasatospora sp. NPDC096077 TaxID=3155544 RepID=UPI00332BE179